MRGALAALELGATVAVCIGAASLVGFTAGALILCLFGGLTNA